MDQLFPVLATKQCRNSGTSSWKIQQPHIGPISVTGQAARLVITPWVSWDSWGKMWWKKSKCWLPPGKLTWQWEIHHLKMRLLLKMVVFHCYVSLPEVWDLIFFYPPAFSVSTHPVVVKMTWVLAVGIWTALYLRFWFLPCSCRIPQSVFHIP